MVASPTLSVGEVAERSGLSVSALHFYERKGLIEPTRDRANRRIYPRHVLRRVAIIRVAQRAGVPLSQIAEALSDVPRSRAPDPSDWERMSEAWHDRLTTRIDALTALRDKMTICIGCGCLSVKACPLMNDNDHMAERGPGAHLLPSTEAVPT